MFKKNLLLLSLTAVLAGSTLFGVSNADAAIKSKVITTQPVESVVYTEKQFSAPPIKYFKSEDLRRYQKVYTVKKEGSNYIIPIVLGQRTNSGYVLDTISVYKSGDNVFIKVKELKPDYRKNYRMVMTYPTSVVTIPAKELSARPNFIVKDTFGIPYRNINALKPTFPSPKYPVLPDKKLEHNPVYIKFQR